MRAADTNFNIRSNERNVLLVYQFLSIATFVTVLR